MNQPTQIQSSAVVWFIGVLTLILTNICQANLNGSDNFNDDLKDPAKWGADFTQGVGLLTETNGRLEYTTSHASPTNDVAARPWILNYGSYTQDWEVHVDASVPQLGFSESLLGLIAAPGTNVLFSNRFSVYLLDSTNEGRKFVTKLGNARAAELATTSTLAGLRIAFNANTKVLSAFYDENGPNCGYSWTLLGSTNISVAWGMTPTNVFGIWIFGRVEDGLAVSSDNLFTDNFYASSGPIPSLAISLNGRKAVLTWPTNGASCLLEFTPTLTSPVCWQIVTNPLSIVGNNFTVTNAVSNTTRFYRLSR